MCGLVVGTWLLDRLRIASYGQQLSIQVSNLEMQKLEELKWRSQLIQAIT